MNKQFYEKSTITSKDNPINITYDELLLKSDEDIDAWAAQVELFGPGTAIPRARRVSNAARVAHSMTRTTREVISTLRIRSVSFT